MNNNDYVNMLFESSTEGLAAISADGKVLANNFLAIKWLNRWNLRSLYSEAQKQCYARPSSYLLLTSEQTKGTVVKVNWLGPEKNIILLSIAEISNSNHDPNREANQNKETVFSSRNSYSVTERNQLLETPGFTDNTISYEKALALAKIGAFQIAVKDGEMTWSSSLEQMFGLKSDTKPSITAFERALESDVRKSIMSQLHAAINEGTSFEAPLRLKPLEGIIPQQAILKVETTKDIHGKPELVLGIVQIDSTDHLKNAEIEQLAKHTKSTIREIDEFAMVIAQDIKNPILKFPDILDEVEQEMGPLISPNSKNLFQHITTTSRKISNLLDGLIIYAQATKDDEHLSWIDARELLLGCIEYLQVPQNIKIELPALWLTMYLDRWRLTQIINQLLGNAIRFNHQEKPIIRIGLIPKSNSVELSVSDNGEGIPVEHQSKVFDLFYSVNPKLNTSGVGLAIVRKLVKAMHGEITLTSSHSEGTTVKVILPCQVGPPKPVRRENGFSLAEHVN